MSMIELFERYPIKKRSRGRPERFDCLNEMLDMPISDVNIDAFLQSWPDDHSKTKQGWIDDLCWLAFQKGDIARWSLVIPYSRNIHVSLWGTLKEMGAKNKIKNVHWEMLSSIVSFSNQKVLETLNNTLFNIFENPKTCSSAKQSEPFQEFFQKWFYAQKTGGSKMVIKCIFESITSKESGYKFWVKMQKKMKDGLNGMDLPLLSSLLTHKSKGVKLFKKFSGKIDSSKYLHCVIKDHWVSDLYPILENNAEEVLLSRMNLIVENFPDVLRYHRDAVLFKYIRFCKPNLFFETFKVFIKNGFKPQKSGLFRLMALNKQHFDIEMFDSWIDLLLSLNFKPPKNVDHQYILGPSLVSNVESSLFQEACCEPLSSKKRRI